MWKYLQLIFLVLSPLGAMAQDVDLEQKVTLRYKNRALGFILSDVSRKYRIPFSYSSNFIPVEQRITISQKRVRLVDALEQLFAPTQIVYTVIGNSIALKVDESKIVVPTIISTKERSQNVEATSLTFLKKTSYPLLVWEYSIPVEVLAEMKTLRSASGSEIPEKEVPELASNRQLAQVTVVPPMSTNAELADETTNTFSLNVLWGKNGGLNGFEVGGLVNNIVNDMRGFQLAGVANQVSGDAQGGQLAFVFNHNQGFTSGMQASLFNIASAANVIQLAGIANIVEQDFEGLQIAIGGNYARTKAAGIQLAGFFNATKGSSHIQLALGLNKATTNNTLQVGLLNIATDSKGQQIGLINVVKETAGTPIGLFSFVKNGYNKVEVGASDLLYANVGLKFGVRKFYNILYFGSRFTEETWSIGYGLGTAFLVGPKTHFHLEYVAAHVNEQEIWTKQLNLLNQFRFNFDWKLKGTGNLFLGPSVNLLVSKRENIENQIIIGSELPLYTILEETVGSTNWKMW
ncbi:MAG: STN domain-containing protein, partial [Bacteroidota bacterium]